MSEEKIFIPPTTQMNGFILRIIIDNRLSDGEGFIMVNQSDYDKSFKQLNKQEEQK